MGKKTGIWSYKEMQEAAQNRTGKQTVTPAPKIFDLTDPKQMENAGPSDLVAFKAQKENAPMVVEKWMAEIIAGAIVDAEFMHLHGPTGTGKTALVEAIAYVPENWRALCALVGAEFRPLEVYPVEMAVFETVSELHFRRALRDGNTYDQPSNIVVAIRAALDNMDKAYPLIWLREMGRVPTASVQGGLLNLMTKGLAQLSDEEMVCAAGISFLTDSNYHTDETNTHVLVTQDDALNRRWTRSVPFAYLSPEQEEEITHYHIREGCLPRVDRALIHNVVALGGKIRELRSQGSLASLAPPSLYGYFAFFRCMNRHPHLSPRQIAETTLLGSACPKDREEALSVFSDVFGIASQGSTSLGV